MDHTPTYAELARRVRELDRVEKEYKRVEEILRHEQELISQMMEISPASIVHVDAGGRVIYANKQAEKLLGLRITKETARVYDDPAWKITDFAGNPIPTENLPFYIVKQTGKSIANIQHAIEWPDGKRILLSINATPFFDDHGVFKGMMATLDDITNQYKAEQNYQMLFREMLDGFALHEIICTDQGKPIDYRFLLVNPAFERMTGLNAQRISGKTVLEVLPGTEFYWIETYGKVALTGEPAHFENYSKELDKYFEVTAFQPAPKHFACIFTDITVRKKAEIELQNKNQLLEGVFDSIKDIIGVQLPDYTIIQYNKAGYQLLGITEAEAIGRKCYELIGRATPCKICASTKSIFSKQLETIEKFIPEMDKHFLCTSNPILDGKGNVKVIIEQLTDITEQKKMDEHLRHSQKMASIATLAGGIAHDFNNILSIIQGNVSIAISLVDKEEELHHILSDIEMGAKQAQSLTQQLLTFARGGEPIKKTMDINRLLEESAKFTLRGAKTRCEFEFKEDLWPADVDEGQMNQVMGNLLINANQAMPNGGIIRIQTENKEIGSGSRHPISAGRYIKIKIEDQGMGISKKYLPSIFDPFFTTKQEGSGLGLSTAYTIIKRHGGHITVDSELDKGTVFSIYIPASSEKLKSTMEKKDIAHKGRGRILVMDDQGPVLKMVGKMLSQMGYEPAFAADGEQAIEKYREAYQSKEPYDLVILDLTVPGGKGGANTIPELLKIDPDVKAVVSSGYSEDPIMANYKDYGFHGVVPKPYTKTQMAEVLNKIFGGEG